MTPKVIYKDAEGKRRIKAVRCSIFADPNEVVREFIKATGLSTSTFIYQVQEGAKTFLWYGKAIEAYD